MNEEKKPASKNPRRKPSEARADASDNPTPDTAMKWGATDNPDPQQQGQIKQPQTSGLKRAAWGAGITVVAVAFLIVVGVLISFYGMGSRDNFTAKAASILHLPVALYEYQPISYTEFSGDIDTLKFFYGAQESENPGLVTQRSDSYLEKSVLSRMIREKFVANRAAARDLAVTDDELNAEFDKVVAQAANREEVAETLKKLYNWNEQQFKEKVLYPYLLNTELQEQLSSDEELNAEAKQRAEEVLAKVNAEEQPFEELAKQYSEDASASAGGDLGYFSEGMMVPEFESAAQALEVGAVSGLVKTQYGYHIIKLTERVPATDDAPEQLRASHILIRTKNVEEWINEQLAEENIAIWQKGLEWKSDCVLVLDEDETCSDNELTGAEAQQPLPSDESEASDDGSDADSTETQE